MSVVIIWSDASSILYQLQGLARPVSFHIARNQHVVWLQPQQPPIVNLVQFRPGRRREFRLIRSVTGDVERTSENRLAADSHQHFLTHACTVEQSFQCRSSRKHLSRQEGGVTRRPHRWRSPPEHQANAWGKKNSQGKTNGAPPTRGWAPGLQSKSRTAQELRPSHVVPPGRTAAGCVCVFAISLALLNCSHPCQQ